jgi:cell division control protein 6
VGVCSTAIESFNYNTCVLEYTFSDVITFSKVVQITEDLTLFDFNDSVEIILNKDVLSPDYIPPRIVGRDEQIKQVASLTKYLFRNGKPDNALIFGPPGCGKTVVSKHVLRSLVAKLKQDPIDVKVEWVYIHCKKVYTSTAIIYTLIKHLDPITKIPMSGHSLNYYYDELFKLMNNKNTAMILILDEIDFLSSDNVLYNFSRAVANEELNDGRFISVIGLSNSIKYEQKIDDRVLSSMGFVKFRFPPYYADPIYQILKDRVDLAFAPESISNELLIQCSIDAAHAGGDIRKALGVLRTAAEIAVANGTNIILQEHLRSAETQVQMEEIIKSVVELPKHHKLVLLSIIKLIGGTKTSVHTGEVMKMYIMLCSQINMKHLDDSMVSKAISSLELQSFIHYVKVNIGKRGGMTRSISLRSEDVDEIKRGIYEDYDLEVLEEYFPAALT